MKLIYYFKLVVLYRYGTFFIGESRISLNKLCIFKIESIPKRMQFLTKI